MVNSHVRTRIISIRLPMSLDTELRRIAEELGRDVSDVIREALRRGLSEIKLNLVFQRYTKGEMSLSQAIDVLGLNPWILLHNMASRNISLRYSDEDLSDDLKSLDTHGVAICSWTPLVFLSKISRLGLLKQLFEEVYVPKEVFEALTWIEDSEKYPEVFLIRKSVIDGVIRVMEVSRERVEHITRKCGASLGRCAVAAIALAKQVRGVLITDDTDSRKVARSKNIPTKGTVYLIIEMVRKVTSHA